MFQEVKPEVWVSSPQPPSINGSFLPERELDPDLIRHHRHRAEVNQQNTGASGEGIDPRGRRAELPGALRGAGPRPRSFAHLKLRERPQKPEQNRDASKATSQKRPLWANARPRSHGKARRSCWHTNEAKTGHWFLIREIDCRPVSLEDHECHLSLITHQRKT